MCFPHVLWGVHVTSEGINGDGDKVSTSSMGGKSELRAVLVQGIDSKVYEGRLLRKVTS